MCETARNLTKESRNVRRNAEIVKDLVIQLPTAAFLIVASNVPAEAPRTLLITDLLLAHEPARKQKQSTVAIVKSLDIQQTRLNAPSTSRMSNKSTIRVNVVSLNHVRCINSRELSFLLQLLPTDGQTTLVVMHRLFIFQNPNKDL